MTQKVGTRCKAYPPVKRQIRGSGFGPLKICGEEIGMKPVLISPTNFKKSAQILKIKLFRICGSRLGSPPFRGGNNYIAFRDACMACALGN